MPSRSLWEPIPWVASLIASLYATTIYKGHATLRRYEICRLETAFKGGGVHLVAVPVDYSENIRVLVEELRRAVPSAGSS
jgi:hypothetical protein